MADTQLARLHVTVDGRVQGVGFRAFVLDFAEILDITGWVRNTSEGQVEVTAEGPRETLERLLAALRQGPHSALVVEVKEEWLTPTGEFNAFRVTRDW